MTNTLLSPAAIVSAKKRLGDDHTSWTGLELRIDSLPLRQAFGEDTLGTILITRVREAAEGAIMSQAGGLQS